MYLVIPCDVTPCRVNYKYPQLLNFWERVDPLGSPLESERLWNLSLGCYPQCQPVSFEKPSGVESTVAVISDFLSVSVANLCKCCFYCYLCVVFSGILEKKAPFCIILLVGLHSRTPTRRFL
ncbi:hypothetical protein AVEN_218842-1 [Araneus ventricosus]|uniref:Uncharacterized protein n=1 Tax=Araneus ventricosus TaxID=182803 RepID=A0A4Y2HS35_ARAVE|nr:hypothetical protein AVEN_218842-1 [Araneus ventricosus]